MHKDESVIPEGYYCYTYEGDKKVSCPYWSIDSTKPKQENGYCSYLEKGDQELAEANGFSLIWDEIKECDIKMDFNEGDFEDAVE